MRDVTTHTPWLAPTGHRQPQAADIPNASGQGVDNLEDQAALDRKLKICRGC
jgi:hypothetical protein